MRMASEVQYQVTMWGVNLSRGDATKLRFNLSLGTKRKTDGPKIQNENQMFEMIFVQT